MGKTVRIDIVIREVDADGNEIENARGMKFGDEVDIEQMDDFFDRSRDGANLIFRGMPRKQRDDELAQLRKEVESMKRATSDAKIAEIARMAKRVEQAGAQDNRPRIVPMTPSDFRRDQCGSGRNDGSRGGDGPSFYEIAERERNSTERLTKGV